MTMTEIRTERRLPDTDLKDLVELTLPPGVQETQAEIPTVGFFRMPEDSHQSVFPPIHRRLSSAIADFPSEGGRTSLESRLEELNVQARTQRDENTSLALASVLRYGLLAGIDLGYLAGSEIPAAGLDHIGEFSVRNTWIGIVAGPIDDDVGEFGEVPLEIRERSRIGFFCGPDRSELFDPDLPLVLDELVLSRTQSGRTSLTSLEIDLTKGMVKPGLAGDDQTLIAFEAKCPEVEEAPSTGAFSVHEPAQGSASMWVPFLYQQLDDTAVAISQELRGLTKGRQDAQFLAMQLRERYEPTILSDSRESRYLNLATDELSDIGRVSDFLARPVILPETVLTPPELDYRALAKVLSGLQDVIAEEGSNSPVGQILKRQWDEINEKEEALVPEVRWSRRRLEHLVQDPGDRRTHYLFHASLATFSPDSDEIKRSLVRQATLLEVLDSLSDLPIEVTYRLYTAPSPSGELGARFEVEATVSDCDAAEAAELRESFGELVHAAFVGAYGLQFGFSRPHRGNEETNLRSPRFEREIVRRRNPAGGYRPFSGRPDWGYILDYLLTLDHQAVIKLRATAGSGSASEAGPEVGIDEVSGDTDSARSVLNEVLRGFANRTEMVSLRVSVGADRQLSSPLLNLVGTEIAGSAFDSTTVGELDEDPDRACMPLAEAFSVFHAPYGQFFASRIGQRTTRLTSAIDGFPVTGIELGSAYRAHAKADRTIRVRIPENDALRHIYVIGRTGSGKTNFLRGLADQHLLSPGTGLAVIDPHGDLASHVLNSVPAARVDEVVTVDVTDPEVLPILNPLALEGSDSVTRSRVVQDVLELMKTRLYHEWSGPRFDEIVRLALDTMLDGGYPVAPALTDVPRILTDSELQGALLKRLRDPELLARWKFHQRLTTTREYPDLIDWAVSKFDDISRDASLRMVFGGERNTVNIDGVVRENGILIVRLPEAEIGRQAAELIGSLVLQQLRTALLRRKQGPSEGGHFFVYVDEFQKFATPAFGELVAEARKYGVGIVLAHQDLDQLTVFSPQVGQQDRSLLGAILGNVGSMVCFGVGAPDIDVMASQFGVSATDVSGIGRYQALARLTLDGAWIPTMSLLTDLHEPRLDPRREEEIQKFQRLTERVLPRAEALRQLEARRVALTELGASEEKVRLQAPAPLKVGNDVESFMSEWRRKREAAKEDPEKLPPPPELKEAIRESGEKRRSGAGEGATGEDVEVKAPVGPEGQAAWSELVGPVVRLERVSEVLDESVETLRGRAALGQMLILRTRSGTEVVPANHFQEGKPLPGLAEVLQELDRTDWSRWSRAGWLNTPLAGLVGKSIIDWLRSGLGPDMPRNIARARAEDE